MPLLKSIWKGNEKPNAKHKKLLSDELDLASNQDFDGDDFYSIKPKSYKVKYLGHVPTHIGNDSKETTSKAVKSITAMSKLNKKQIKKVFINVTLKGIEVIDRASDKILFEISVLRICNFFTDSKAGRTFAFLATNDRDTTECHAFVSSKKNEAENITLTMAQIFKITYRVWQDSQDGLYRTNWSPIQTIPENQLKPCKPISSEAPTTIPYNNWISFNEDLMEDVSDAGTGLLTFAEVNDFPPAYYTEQPNSANQSQIWKKYELDIF